MYRSERAESSIETNVRTTYGMLTPVPPRTVLLARDQSIIMTFGYTGAQPWGIVSRRKVFRWIERLLVSQGLDRIQEGSAAGGVGAEEDSDGRGEAKGHEDGP